MHTQRLTELALWLEAGAPHQGTIDKFDMNVGVGVGQCGTACCIAGAATQFFGGEQGKLVLDEAATEFAQQDPDDTDFAQASFFGERGSPFAVLPLATELLELDDSTAKQLFLPTVVDEDDWGQITPAMAAVTIRQLIETGKVDWTHLPFYEEFDPE